MREAIAEQWDLARLERVFGSDAHPSVQTGHGDLLTWPGGHAHMNAYVHGPAPSTAQVPPGTWAQQQDAPSPGSRIVSATTSTLAQVGAALGSAAMQAAGIAFRAATGGLSQSDAPATCNIMERVGAALAMASMRNPPPETSQQGEVTHWVRLGV